MPSLSIKDVPEELVARLRARARGHHRSLQGELLAILEEAVQVRGFTIQDVARRVKELGLSTGDESAGIVRAERDAR